MILYWVKKHVKVVYSLEKSYALRIKYYVHSNKQQVQQCAK